MQDNIGNTPLHDAREPEEVRKLLEQGADPNARNKYSETPLTQLDLPWADETEETILDAISRMKDIATILVEHGADINLQANEEGSLLHRAANSFYGELQLSERGIALYADFIRHLVRLGADIGLRTAEGNTPLHAAQLSNWWDGKDKATAVLIECGADVNAQNDFGWTPLIVAVRSQHAMNGIACLIESGADINVQDEQGMAALHHLANTNNVETAACLTSHGARTDLTDHLGRTPYQIALESKQQEMAALLKGSGMPGVIAGTR